MIFDQKYLKICVFIFQILVPRFTLFRYSRDFNPYSYLHRSGQLLNYIRHLSTKELSIKSF